ncbi:MAG: hypothetical protein E2O68_04920 [Deltaproteobacteria bacterium]|nr:MAG: hypothetical protein E2O68_04920 [Deltaproteobacteria bacterium]
MLKLLIFLLLIPPLASAGEFIVKFDQDTSIEEFNEFIDGDFFESVWGKEIDDENFFKSPVFIKTDRKLSKYPLIQSVQENFTYEVQFPDDPKLEKHWALNNDSMKKIWAEVTECQRIPVAILDTGVNFDHEDLRDTFWQKRECKYINGEIKESCAFGFNFIDQSQRPVDFNGHGTYMASLIGAVGDNSRGISGICQRATIMALKVLDNFGKGSTLQIVRGIRFATDNGARILNLSFGRFGPEDLLLKEELARATRLGSLVVTPAGNYGVDLNEKKFWPCSFEMSGLLCVASLNRDSELSSFSNFGSEVVDLAAPGADILGAGIGEFFEDDLDFGMFGPGWKVLKDNENCLDIPSPTLVYPSNFCELKEREMDLPKVKWAGGKYSLLEFKTNQKKTMSKIELIDCGGDCLVSFSEKGPLAIWDIKIKTMIPSNKHYEELSGTSISAGYVSGVAALLWSYNRRFSLIDLKIAIIRGGRSFEHLVDGVKQGLVIWPSDNLIYLNKPGEMKAEISP